MRPRGGPDKVRRARRRLVENGALHLQPPAVCSNTGAPTKLTARLRHHEHPPSQSQPPAALLERRLRQEVVFGSAQLNDLLQEALWAGAKRPGTARDVPTVGSQALLCLAHVSDVVSSPAISSIKSSGRHKLLALLRLIFAPMIRMGCRHAYSSRRTLYFCLECRLRPGHLHDSSQRNIPNPNTVRPDKPRHYLPFTRRRG